MENWLFRGAWILLAIGGACVLAFATAQANGVLVFKGTAVDLTVILLATATLVVTGVGVTVGVVAIWGFKEIKEKSIEAAKVEARVAAAELARDIASSVAARTALEAIDQELARIRQIDEARRFGNATLTIEDPVLPIPEAPPNG